MAQQLALLRTAEAYAGVAAYARSHTGEAAATAYLALGHAYLLDKRYAEAAENLALAKHSGSELADYDDYLGAKADHEAGNEAAAEALLHGFTDRYPESIFDLQEPELEANVLLALNNLQGARQVLADAQGTASANRSAFQLATGQVEFALGQTQTAEATFKHVLMTFPLSPEAQTARAKLTQMGAESTLTVAELRSLGDAYFNAGRNADAEEQFRALLREPGLDAATRNSIAVAEAACELKLKRLTPAQAQALPDTDDENGAHRLDLLMELARERNDADDQQRIVTEMETRFPHSPWLADALFSSGNMYLLSRDYAKAVEYYGYLAAHFPNDKNAAAAHWKAGWLSYRQHIYAEAERIFDEQIKLYPAAVETVAALYWRARLFETQDHQPAQAVTPERWRQIEDLYNSRLRSRGPGSSRTPIPSCGGKSRSCWRKVPAERYSTEPPFDLMTDCTAQTQMTAGSQLGPYRIEALLGHGGMGEVFRATDTRLGREVAIKVSQERFTDRFEREARAIAALNHPNICTLHDVGPNYLVMELVEGETLAARLKRGRLPMEQTIQYGAQIASALSAAHAKGIVHRDLKPGNVMITKTGVKVLDFGLAKSTQDETAHGYQRGHGHAGLHGPGATGRQGMRCAHGHLRAGSGAVGNGHRQTDAAR